MSISVLDHSVSGQSGLSYAPPSGSNRLVVMCVCVQASVSPTLTNITWNSVVRTPCLSDPPTGSIYTGNFICVFDEADGLPSTSKSITPTWSTAPDVGIAIFIYTLGGALQSTAKQASAASNQQTATSPQSVVMSGIAASWLSIGMISIRDNSNAITNTWGNSDFAPINFSSGAGYGVASSHVSTGTSDTYDVSFSGPTDIAQDLIGFAPASGSTKQSGQFFLSSQLLPLAPLGWIIGRRNKLAGVRRSWRQNQKSRLFLPQWKKVA